MSDPPDQLKCDFRDNLGRRVFITNLKSNKACHCLWQRIVERLIPYTAVLWLENDKALFASLQTKDIVIRTLRWLRNTGIRLIGMLPKIIKNLLPGYSQKGPG